jgi:hypothetical protein
MNIETRVLLGAVYRGLRSRTYPHRMLSHAVEVDDDGVEVRVLCGRVQLESLADPLAGDTAERPTCQACLRRDRRYRPL